MAEPNLHSILASEQIDSVVLQCKCSESHLATIAQSITSWKQLSPFLGLTQQDEEDIQADNSRNAERKVAMLRRWRERSGNEATYLRLAEAFEVLKWRDCISKLLDLFQRESAQSASSLSRTGTNKTGESPSVSPLGINKLTMPFFPFGRAYISAIFGDVILHVVCISSCPH